MTPVRRRLTRWLTGALTTCTLLCGCRAESGAPREGSPAGRTGKLLITVRTPVQATVEGITVYVRDGSGHVDSSVTNARGLVTFTRVAAGRVIVRTADKIWLRRKKGAFIGRVDTIIVVGGRTSQHMALTTQRDPPAIFR